MFKAIRKFFSHRFDRFYRQKRLRLILDISLIALMIGLVVTIFSLQFYRPGANFKAWFKPSQPVYDSISPPLELSYKIDKTAIKLEDSLDISLTLKNSSENEIKNLKLNLVLQTDNFLISKIEAPIKAEDLKAEGNSLSIKDKNIILAKLEANSEREFALKIYFSTKNDGARTISWRVDSEYKVLEQTVKKSWSLPEIIVALKPMVIAYVYYHSPQGDQLGSGPLPPIVGLPTNFWVFLNAEAGSSFSDLVVSARLAKNVIYTENSSLVAGNLNYSSDSQQVIWQINKIDAIGGLYRAAFEVRLTPGADQLNSVVNLLENLKWQAKDELSGLIVSGSLGNLDTSLKADLINRGSGHVSSFEPLED